MLPGYADENVKAAIVAGLRQLGMDVVTAQERGQRRTDDEIRLAAATAEGRLLLTNDTDFLRIHAEWMAVGRVHAGIVYWPQDRPVGDIVRRLFQYALRTDTADVADAVKYLRPDGTPALRRMPPSCLGSLTEPADPVGCPHRARSGWRARRQPWACRGPRDPWFHASW